MLDRFIDMDHVRRYCEIATADQTANGDYGTQGLLYVLSSDFGVYDNYRAVYIPEKHAISDDYMRLVVSDCWGPFSDSAVQVLLRRAMHLYNPGRYPDVSTGGFCKCLVGKKYVKVATGLSDLSLKLWSADLASVIEARADWVRKQEAISNEYLMQSN